MQPNGQMPPAQTQQNPYDYIINPGTPPKNSFANGSGKPKKIVMVAFVLGGLLLVVIGIAVFSSLTSKNYESIVGLAQRQQEIIRVSELGLKDANDPSARVYLSTVHSVTISEQNATVAFLSKKGLKVDSKILVLKKDTSTDTSLQTAKQNNTFDQVVLTKLNGEISDYRQAQKAVTGIDNSKSEKALFATLNANSKNLTGTN